MTNRRVIRILPSPLHSSRCRRFSASSNSSSPSTFSTARKLQSFVSRYKSCEASCAIAAGSVCIIVYKTPGRERAYSRAQGGGTSISNLLLLLVISFRFVYQAREFSFEHTSRLQVRGVLQVVCIYLCTARSISVRRILRYYVGVRFLFSLFPAWTPVFLFVIFHSPAFLLRMSLPMLTHASAHPQKLLVSDCTQQPRHHQD